MNPQEEQGLELAKEGVKNLLEPVKDLLRRLLGPAATEIGLGFGDSFRVWRLKRVLKLLEEVKKVASDAGLHLKPVAPHLLFPILEAASLQEDENLHKRWVALLTNAAREDFGEVPPSFPEMLKQLRSEEAQLLDEAYDQAAQHQRVRRNLLRRRPVPKKLSKEEGDLLSQLRQALHRDDRMVIVDSAIGNPIRNMVCSFIGLDNLERLMLIRRGDLPIAAGLRVRTEKRFGYMPAVSSLSITELGKAFVQACRLPKKAEAKKK